MIDAENGQILDANPAASRIYGYTHDEFLTMKNTDVSAEPAKTSEATIENAAFVPIRKHRKKDGTVFSVELSAGFTNLKDKKVHIITARDITERLRIQEALRESEKNIVNWLISCHKPFTNSTPKVIYCT
jgi:PAS domain S-box-containing protein